jgi:hypothetical protein
LGGRGGGRWQNGRHTSRPSISTTWTCPPTRAHQPSTPPSPKKSIAPFGAPEPLTSGINIDRPRARVECSERRVLMQRAPRGQRRAQAQHTLALLNMGVDGGATGVVARARSRARDRALARADVMACLRRVSADSREPRAEGHTRGQPTADSRPAARAAGGAHAPRASAGIVARARALARSRAQVHVCAGVGARPAHLAQPGAGGCARPPYSLCTLVHPAACASCHFIKILIILENRFGGEGGRGRWQNGRHTSRPSISTTWTCPPTRAHQPSTPPSPKQNQSGRLAQLNR